MVRSVLERKRGKLENKEKKKRKRKKKEPVQKILVHVQCGASLKLVCVSTGRGLLLP